ncbi:MULTISPECIES: hypothetical protein [Antarcticibacterium]|uniref:hypothetical protein n=1 Tax=Antarcticibacterium TaxID=2058174 RepID=UPI00143D6F8F|nr:MULTISPECIES: hypothetical protein [Antarcticibacterium]
MKYTMKIEEVQTVDEIKEFWTNEDYVQLLEKFNYPGAEDTGSESIENRLRVS